VLVDAFIASHKQPPRELVLDIDATHVPLHGAQQRAHFHYDNYCYLAAKLRRAWPQVRLIARTAFGADSHRRRSVSRRAFTPTRC
jgi:hypothetical protein